MFTLIWSEDALDQLADIYVGLTPQERQRLANSVAALNGRLQTNPEQEGESRSDGYRLVFITLAAVMFHVDLSARVVTVSSITRYGQ